MKSLIVRTLRHLNTSLSGSIVDAVQKEEWDKLPYIEVDPLAYEDPYSYLADAQAAALVRKVPWPTSFNRSDRAYEKFLNAELKCAETNAFLKAFDFELLRASCPPEFKRFDGILRKAKRIITRILGSTDVDLEGRFGPGTSFELKGSAFTTLADKVYTTPKCTSACYLMFNSLYQATAWGRERRREVMSDPDLVRGNRFTTVPKDGKTDRGIAIEPLGNLFCQLGWGRILKKRLGRVGLHVQRFGGHIQLEPESQSRRYNDGQAIHRDLARLGSLGGGWATIDLSDASDTVSLELVRRLLPDDWFRVLNSCRSPFTLARGKWVRLEKFSSMGNGFTFELETLVFCALACAVSGLKPGVDCFVYGDDIIVPERTAADVLAILRFSGFIPNEKKSFTKGRFRESCGGDYFDGIDVRPVFIKKTELSVVEMMELHNNLLTKVGPGPYLSSYVSSVPKRYRLFGPRGLTGVFWDDDPAHWEVRTGPFGGPKSPTHCRYTRWVRAVDTVPETIPLDRWSGELDLVLALLGVSSRGLNPRDLVTHPLRWVSIS